MGFSAAVGREGARGAVARGQVGKVTWGHGERHSRPGGSVDQKRQNSKGAAEGDRIVSWGI